MRQERFDKATPLLNRAYNETLPQERSRPLVLNRALLDLVQKSNALRGIRELSAYLATQPEADEEASNLLGSLLDLAARNPKWRDGPIYSEGFREFARREAMLERSREGFKRWGAKWITQEEFDRIKQRDKELEAQIVEQGKTIERLNLSTRSLNEQYANAERQIRGFGNHSHRRSLHGPSLSSSSCTQCRAMYEAQASLNEIGAEMHGVAAEARRVVRLYEDLQKRVTRPTWPRRYEPIEPSATQPPPVEDAGAEVVAAPATRPAN